MEPLTNVNRSQQRLIAWRIYGANMLTNFADVMFLTALPLVAVLFTRDPNLIAGLSVTQQLPWLLFSLPLGVWLDRADRRKAYIGIGLTGVILAASFGLLINLESIYIITLYCFALLIGMTELAIDSTSPILIRQALGRDKLQTAYSQLATGRLVGEAIAAVSAGLLFSMSASLPFFIQCGAIAIATSMIFGMRGNFQNDVPSTQNKLWHESRQGFVWLWKEKIVRNLTILTAARSFFSRLVFGVFILFALEIVQLTPTGYGIISAFFTVGGISGSWTSKHLVKWMGQSNTLTFTLLLNGLSYIIMVLWPSPYIAAFFMFVVAFSFFVWNVISTSVWRTIIPENLQGRVGSAYQLFTWGIGPIGALLGGVLAANWGLTAPLWIGGIGMLITTSVCWRVLDNKIIVGS